MIFVQETDHLILDFYLEFKSYSSLTKQNKTKKPYFSLRLNFLLFFFINDLKPSRWQEHRINPFIISYLTVTKAQTLVGRYHVTLTRIPILGRKQRPLWTLGSSYMSQSPEKHHLSVFHRRDYFKKAKQELGNLESHKLVSSSKPFPFIWYTQNSPVNILGNEFKLWRTSQAWEAFIFGR